MNREKKRYNGKSRDSKFRNLFFEILNKLINRDKFMTSVIAILTIGTNRFNTSFTPMFQSIIMIFLTAWDLSGPIPYFDFIMILVLADTMDTLPTDTTKALFTIRFAPVFCFTAFAVVALRYIYIR